MPSYRSVNFPFVVTYTIENKKIVSHWLVADQMVLMEQLGIEPALAAH
jgi:predicted ester cyclase